MRCSSAISARHAGSSDPGSSPSTSRRSQVRGLQRPLAKGAGQASSIQCADQGRPRRGNLVMALTGALTACGGSPFQVHRPTPMARPAGADVLPAGLAWRAMRRRPRPAVRVGVARTDARDGSRTHRRQGLCPTGGVDLDTFLGGFGPSQTPENIGDAVLELASDGRASGSYLVTDAGLAEVP